MIIQIIKIIITNLLMIFQTKVVKLKSKNRQNIAKRLNLNQYVEAMRMQN